MAGIRQFEAFCERHDYREALRVLALFRATVRPNRKYRPATSKSVTPAIKRQILSLHTTTDANQHEIAEIVGVNQGRVNEVINNSRSF